MQCKLLFYFLLFLFHLFIYIGTFLFYLFLVFIFFIIFFVFFRINYLKINIIAHDELGHVQTTLREWIFVPESGPYSMPIRPAGSSSR